MEKFYRSLEFTSGFYSDFSDFFLTTESYVKMFQRSTELLVTNSEKLISFSREVYIHNAGISSIVEYMAFT